VRVIVEFCLLMILASVCVSQSATAGVAEIRKVRITRASESIRLEFVLSRRIEPKLTIATEPDRLVLDLLGTKASPRQRRIAVNRNGVKQIRVGLNSSDPMVTRAVIDLDGARPYELATAGSSIVLTVLPPIDTAESGQSGSAPIPAASNSLLAKLRARKHIPHESTTAKLGTLAGKTQPPDPNLHVLFKVKYVAEGVAYLTGGRNSGLTKGMKLVVRDGVPAADSSMPRGPVVAELQVISVAGTSAVTEIHSPKRDVAPGDWAELSEADYRRLGEQPVASNSVSNPAPASLETLKPKEVEAAAPDVSRIRARIGLDYSGISSSGSTLGRSSSMGMSFSADVTRIAGTSWNLQGNWRGRLTSNTEPDEGTLQDYLDRTYTIQLFYDNPNSKWVAGFGRLYLPWAVSLDTIDGGYVGQKVATGVTMGVFLGSTPDPSSWHYRPDQQIAGSSVNFEHGNYDDFHSTSTAGFAVDLLKWQLDRPYFFLENELSYSRLVSVYHSLIVDSPQGISTNGIALGAGVGRSYLSVRVNPKQWISFDLSHNYFRDAPTAATVLIGTGLVDKLLYQGVNAGVRVEPGRKLAVYASLGQSDKTGDMTRSLNQMYGVTWNEIWRSGIRADVHYSKFDSSFARGEYRVLSLSRHLGNRTIWDTQVGSQNLNSALTTNQHSLFLDSSFDTNFGSHTFLQSGYTVERGAQLNYTQWRLSLGYRVDAKGANK
jgi:AMIN domain